LLEFLVELICDSRFLEAQMPATDSLAAQSRPILLVGVAGAVSLAIALAAGLWAYYGTTVFFEMLRAGWAACF
jgi:hypothetical protein